MAMQKLSSDIQSLFCASTQIWSYKRAVEELVYNSLDAESTSIAIRINIEQNSIQVIDNGCGVSKSNFSLIGHKHATSKCVELSTLKSAPNTYGYRGQALASIIEVSKHVKITSRCQDANKTWEKSFHKAKEQKLSHTKKRPSKGTTVDIKGFLYNLNIQKNAVDSLTELNDIKSFLEQLSLVHNNISVSLRDDTKNEIIFKLHKNRDIYQTLTSLYSIERKDIQELKVEKNQYKVTAYIGKEDKESCQKRWIYLNGRVLRNSKLQKIVNDNLKKLLKLNLQNTRKVKSKHPNNQEDHIIKKGIPFYFVFVTCPYNDYDITYAPKQTEVEFKNWEPINKLVEKMTKFYAGDTHSKLVKNQVANQRMPENTRDQVKKIMDKILGSNPKKIGVSQLQNGIKGKVTKRKPKKNINKITVAKVLSTNTKKINKKEIGNLHVDTTFNLQNPKEIEPSKTLRTKPNKLVKCTKTLHKIKNKMNDKNIEQRSEIRTESVEDNFTPDIVTHHDITVTKRRKLHEIKNKNLKLKKANHNTRETKLPHNKLRNATPPKNSQNLKMMVKKSRKDVHYNKIDPLIKIFKEPTGSVKRKCYLLANKVNNLMSFKKKRKRKIFVNETVQYSNIVRNNKNYSVRKKIEEVVIHDYIPKPSGFSLYASDDIGDKDMKKNHKSSYDLVKTVLRNQVSRNSYSNEAPKIGVASDNTFPESFNDDASDQTRYRFPAPNYMEDATITKSFLLPRLTFESHNYAENWNRISHNYNDKHMNYENLNESLANVRFITTQSKDNFAIPMMNPKPRKNFNRIKHVEIQSNKIDLFSKRGTSEKETSYTIEFSKSRENYVLNDKIDLQKTSKPFKTDENEPEINIEEESCTNMQNNEFESELNSQTYLTYTIDKYSTNHNKIDKEERYFEGLGTVDVIEDSTERLTHEKIEIENQNDNPINRSHKNINVVFISKSQEMQASNNLVPIHVGESLYSHEYEGHESILRDCNDSLFIGDLDIDSFLCDRNAYTQNNLYEPTIESFHNFNTDNRNGPDHEKIGSVTACNIFDTLNQQSDKIVNNKFKSQLGDKQNDNVRDKRVFNFKNRLRFVPKGMSQIFTNYHTRNVCNYNLDQHCYGQEIYNNFAENVQSNCEIFGPAVENVKEVTTKAIEKVKNKVNKDAASLVFQADDLKQAKCYRQADNKFIAAKIKGRSNQALCLVTECLVLFDQHAVHERIRLENNLSDYFNGIHWKSIPLDNFTLKLTKDEALYLHNYKDKFNQLGLQWVNLGNGEVSIIAIPEAILGKHPRQVEVVVNAVKNLIIEEINAIKNQSGCITLYPKSIMDLVFSEACRYAIKFGDPLSHKECENLLNSLSECKVPFQCAHGRPVMAVLLDIKKDSKKYEINPKSLQYWVKKKKQVKKK
ncbi:hypothetical protein O0L34_g17468 [Tuta absoluta]|nr:hypothetical protein O0L34_g17468 [Tuta absoluta]